MTSAPEHETVLITANAILEDHWRDPDGTLSMLARQLLRRQDALVRVVEWYEALPNDIFDEMPDEIRGARHYVPELEK